MICKKKKNKYICAFLLSLILVCGLLQSSVLSCNTYASSSTTTVNDYLNSNNFYDVCAYFCRGFASFPDPYGGGTGFTVEAFADYLEEKGKSSILQEPVTITEDENNSSGGRGYDLPQDARQEIINFVNETVIEAEPLTYTQCYISSYNYLNTSQFTSYQLYSSIKEVIKQHDLSFIMAPNGWDTYNGRYGYICCVDRSKFDLNFYGSTTSGVFTSVYLEHNWSQFGFPYNQAINGIEYYMFANNKTTLGHGNTIQECWYNFMGYNGSNWTPPTNGTIKNTTGIGTSTSALNVFTGSTKNELVYVFNTLNALKAYNVGMPQPYYLLTDGNLTAPISDIVTPSKLEGAGNFYNSIVNNVNSGDTPEEVQKTVKNGLLGNLLDTLTGSNSSVVEDNGNFDMSFLGTIKDLVLGVTGAIDPAQQLITTDLKRFVTDIFGWLPAEIVTFWIAGILFSVLFGVLKIVRG